jgi:hypothetical protein
MFKGFWCEKMKCKYTLSKNVKCDKKAVYIINALEVCSKHAECLRPFSPYIKV